MTNSRSRQLLRVGPLIAVLMLLAISGYEFWLYHRPLPANIQETLFDGITYIRDVRHEPRPLVIHIITIDLNTPGLRFFVTPDEPYQGRALRAQTTSQFLDKYHVQIAINGGFFTPWWFYSIFDYYPHIGDPVDVHGFASSEGHAYSAAMRHHPTLYLSRDNRAQFDEPVGEMYNAVSGNELFVEQGQIATQVLAKDYNDGLNPRTAVALNRSGRTMLLLIVDGRQPNYSEGVTLAELGQIVIEYGGDTALNLDGGGSSTLVIEGQASQPIILNSPIDNYLPGRERAVANHLGIYASKNNSNSSH